jgi:hypothetical protein
MSKIYAFVAFVGGLILAFLKIFSMGKTSAQNEIKAQTEETAREYENAGSEALIKGLEKESDEDNTSAGDHFSR